MLVIRENEHRYAQTKFIKQIESVADLLRKVETAYDLPFKSFYLTNEKTDRVIRKYKKTNLTNIRMAIVFVILETEQMNDGVFADALQMERTAIIYLRQTSRNLFDVKDKIFLDNCEKVRQMWKSKTLQICKLHVTLHHEQKELSNQTYPCEYRGIFERQAI